ncbi:MULTISPECIES: LUD domain-containing protein [Streptomyces]|uniref:LUD domain-containing protein n=1 Tax=Streptomyces sp. 900129855 TaxID=3155129 RepID=A0ABV2ZP98_9ACTN
MNDFQAIADRVEIGAGETLRLAGIGEDINAGGRYDAVRPRVPAIDRVTGADEIRRRVAGPEFVVNSVAAVTETGSLVLASGSGSQLPADAGGAARAVWVVGAQKVVPDLNTALRRVEEHALPLENALLSRPRVVPTDRRKRRQRLHLERLLHLSQELAKCCSN